MKIAFTMSKGSPISETIVFFTKHNSKIKPYVSHSLPILGDFHGLQLGMSADELMCNVIDVARYFKKGKAIRIYEIQEEVQGWQKKIIEKYNQVNYGWFELLWFVYKFIRVKINKNWKGKNPISMGIICTELSFDALELAGFGRYLKGIDRSTIDAIELENIVASIPSCKLIETSVLF
jgi:hypothetical protein